MRCLVTGGSGFIGRHLLRRLREDGHDVTTVGRHPMEGQHIVLSDFKVGNLRAAISQSEFDVVFHLVAAGVNPNDRDEDILRYINADMPAEMVQLCAEKNIRKFILTGSCSEYSDDSSHNLRHEDANLEKGKLYGATKAEGGLRAIEIGNKQGVDVIVFRLFNVYGPGEAQHRLLPSIWEGAHSLNGIPMSQGTQQRDFIYVEDVCDALVQAARNQQFKTGIYNLCTGVANSVRDFVTIACEEIGLPIERLNFGMIPMRPDEIAYLVGDPQKLEDTLGWKATTGLRLGISKTVKFLLDNKS